jgi:hypothetical protein
LQFIKLNEENAKLKSVAAENAALQKEIKSLRGQVGNKRRIQDAPMRPGAGTGGGKTAPEKQKLAEPGTRGGLDKAFRDWEL